MLSPSFWMDMCCPQTGEGYGLENHDHVRMFGVRNER